MAYYRGLFLCSFMLVVSFLWFIIMVLDVLFVFGGFFGRFLLAVYVCVPLFSWLLLWFPFVAHMCVPLFWWFPFRGFCL